MREIGHFIGGKPVAGTSGRTADVFNPASGEITGKVALASTAEVDAAVEAANAAWPAWASMPPLRRARVMFKFKELLERDREANSPPSSPPSTARCCRTPTVSCSAAWRSSSSPAASRI